MRSCRGDAEEEFYLPLDYWSEILQEVVANLVLREELASEGKRAEG